MVREHRPARSLLRARPLLQKMLSLLNRNRDELNGTLTDKQQETLEKYVDVSNEMHAISERSAFRYGFCLGVRLMMESVTVKLTTEDE